MYKISRSLCMTYMAYDRAELLLEKILAPSLETVQ